MALPSTIYATATPANPSSDLTDVVELIDLSLLPAAAWNACDSSDATKARAAENDGTEVACYIDENTFVNNMDGTGEGWMYVRRYGTRSSSGSQPIRVWLPTAAMSSYLPSDTYGRDNVQRSSTAMLYTMASDPAVDITGNGNTGTASGGLTIGGESDSLGPLTDFGGNTNGYKITSALDPAIFNAVDAKFSIEVRASVNFNADTYFAQFTSDASGDNAIILLCYQNRVYFDGYSSDGKYLEWSTSSTYSGQREIALTYDGSLTQSSRGKIYIDGQSVSVNYASNGTVASIKTNTTDVTIGNVIGQDSYAYGGNMGRVAVHSDVLPANYIEHKRANESDPDTFWGTWTTGTPTPISTSFTMRAVGAATIFDSYETRASGSARLALFNFTMRASGTASLYRSVQTAAAGKASVFLAASSRSSGRSSQYLGANAAAAGQAKQANTFDATATGRASLANPFSATASGRAMLIYIPAITRSAGMFSLANTFANTASGRASVRAGFAARMSGRASVLQDHLARAAGAASISRTFETRASGSASIMLNLSARVLGVYRTANDALDRFELYVGEGASPDLTTTPAATSATLPMSYALAAPGSGSTDYHVVVKRRNIFGLASQNVYERVVTVNANGSTTQGLTSPRDTTMTAQAASYVQVRSYYDWNADASPADSWAVYVTTDGSDPDPDNDTPDIVAVSYANQYARLTQNLGPFTEGATIKVLVRLRRSADLAETQNLDIKSVVASSLGPDVVTQSDPFLGHAYRAPRS